MRVLITTQVFPPEVHPTAIMVTELAEDLARRDWQVTVGGGYPHHPYGRLYPGYRKKLVGIEEHDGFRVVRGWHLIHPGHGGLARGLVMASQSLARLFSAFFASRPQVVISYGIPLISPLVSALIARMFRARLVTVIYDIYPDVAIELGKLRNPALIWAARQLEGLVYRCSDQLVVLSEGFRRTLMAKGLAPEKVKVIPVWLDARDIVPMDRDNPWRREMGIPASTFVVLYAGTIGLISGAAMLLEAARQLAAYPDILFLMVGEGYAKAQVEAEARAGGIKNIRFLPFQPRECLSAMQATADVSLVTIAPGMGRTSVPSKVLGYMAAARPVLAAVDADCDTAALVQQAKCGMVVPPAQAEALAQAVLFYYHNPKERQRAREAGRKYFKAHLERQVVTRKYINFIEAISNGKIID